PASLLFVSPDTPQFAEEAPDSALLVRDKAIRRARKVGRRGNAGVVLDGDEVMREAILFELSFVRGRRPHRREGLALDFEYLRDVRDVHGADGMASGDPHGLIMGGGGRRGARGGA